MQVLIQSATTTRSESSPCRCNLVSLDPLRLHFHLDLSAFLLARQRSVIDPRLRTHEEDVKAFFGAASGRTARESRSQQILKPHSLEVSRDARDNRGMAERDFTGHDV